MPVRTLLIRTLHIIEIGRILYFDQFGILSIRDFVQFAILSNLGLRPFQEFAVHSRFCASSF